MSALVFLVDDDPVVTDLLSLELRASGFDVEAMGSAPEAMGMLEHLQPDILLLDLNMPAGGGLELLDYLNGRGRLQATRVLMLTAEDDGHFIARARRLGASGYLVKPVDGPRLVSRVRRLLAERDVRWIDDQSVLTAAAAEPAPTLAARTLLPPAADQALASLNPVVAGFVTTYGVKTVSRLLTSLMTQLDALEPGRDGAGDLQHAAHGIKGAAASLGFAVVAEACAELERACRDGEAIEAPLQDASRICAATREVLAGRLKAAA